VFSLFVLSSCRLPLPPTCLLLMPNEARSYFAPRIATHCLLLEELSENMSVLDDYINNTLG
jgi:hypothetical protein